jgi:hypothetical protein
VDAGERPDLLERVREGALHVFSCPRCGQTVEADAPLLLYFSRAPLRLSGREVRLLFSPARRTRPQEDEAQAGALLARLREALGPAWREEWLREGLPVLLRSLLPLFLREDPEAAPRALTRTLEEFIGARTWEESRRILEAHPELLTDEADALLGQWIAAAQARGDEEARRILEEHRVLLRRCREVGIEEAFAERRWGSELVQTLFAFIQAETWEESRRILEAHPELLTDEADAVLGQLVQVQEDQDARRFLEELRALLRRCREVGVEQAFAELSGPPIPPEFQADLRRAQEGKARYRQTGDLAVLNEAIAAYERILNHPAFSQADERFRLWVWNDAGNAYIRRYWRTGSIADLDKALALWQQAVEATPPDSPDRPMFLNNLGTGLRERYERTGRLEDLEAAIRVFREAVEATPPDSPNRPTILTSLGNGLGARYERTGRLEDLEEAIRVFREAVEAAPPGSPNRPGFLNSLGGGLFRRYERTGRLEDLEEAIRVYREAVEATPPGSPDRPGILNNLGAGLRDRYERTGRLEDLEEAIRVFREAVEATPPGSPDRPGILNNLGNGLRNRYERTGRLEDLEEAIRVYREAVEATPPGSPDRPMFLNNLGTGLRERYERTGRLEDLEEAIRVYREAVEATPPDSPNRPSRLTSLGNGLRARYERTGRLEDLEEAIRVFREAVEAAPPGSPNRPGFLNNLGGGLFRRYERTGRLEDLEEAIRVYREAVEATSPDSPDRPGILNNLGAGLSDRYERTGRLEDLEEAIRVFREAVEATPPGSPDRPGILNNLGIGLRDRYERTGRLEDLEEAIRVFREACVQGLQSNPPHALGAGRNWLVWAFRRGAWEEALEAHGYAVQAAEALLSSQFGYPDKAFSLGEAQGLPARAAFSAWRRGQPTKAVEIVEQGRAQLLREALERRRRDLHALAGTPYEPYYTAYIQATRHLDDLQAIPYPQRPPDWGIRIARALAAQQAAIEALRQNVPGFAYFLKSMPFSEIQRQAAEAPLVYMLTTQYGGLALIVRAGGEPQAVELPELTEEALRDRLNAYFGAYARWRDHPQDQSACQAWFAALDEACRWLWDVAMGRVVEALAGARSAVLIPTGLLGFLPFHAAWREDPAAPTGRRYALDDLLLTYAPSAHALAAARQVAARAPADRLFAVDNPDGSLLFSEEEVAAALKHFAPDQRRLLGGEAATRKAVLKEIPRYSVLHFSTHGRADLEEPLRSGLWMADGALSLGDLMDLRLEGARLAVLSACETGLPGAKLPEEAVSLPSGLIQAGVAGVVGSLWAVSDVSTALLMARFYDLWRKEGLEPPEALRQAQIWLRDSTNAEKEAFFRHALPELGATRLAERAAWVAFWDAVVRRPQDRDFAHPFHWAAFSYMGA